MVLTHRTQKLGELIDLVSKPQGDLLVKYQKFITPRIPKLRARYQQYGSSDFPYWTRSCTGLWRDGFSIS